MFVTNHVLAGTLVGLALAEHPTQALAGGLASHVVMDLTPHWGDATRTDDEFFEVARRDGLVALGVLAAVLVSSRSPRRSVVAGVFGAVLLDLDKPFRRFLGVDVFPHWVNRFHHRIQNEAPHRVPYEVAAGAGLAAATVGGLVGSRLRRARGVRVEELLVGGARRQARGGATFTVREPATGGALADVARAGTADVDAALAIATRAFEKGSWARTGATSRGRVLGRVAALIRDRADELATLEARNAGKPIGDSPVTFGYATCATITKGEFPAHLAIGNQVFAPQMRPTFWPIDGRV